VASHVFPGPAAPVDRDDISRMTPHGRLPDGAFLDRVAMFVGRAVESRNRIPAVLTNQVHDLGAVKRATLAIRVAMAAAA
jgi:hypothetical protein